MPTLATATSLKMLPMILSLIPPWCLANLLFSRSSGVMLPASDSDWRIASRLIDLDARPGMRTPALTAREGEEVEKRRRGGDDGVSRLGEAPEAVDGTGASSTAGSMRRSALQRCMTSTFEKAIRPMAKGRARYGSVS
jgi:hypothetical protein